MRTEHARAGRAQRMTPQGESSSRNAGARLPGRAALLNRDRLTRQRRAERLIASARAARGSGHAGLEGS